MNLSTDPTAPPVRLLTDGMLGRLTRWLRLLGYDTIYAPDTDDAELLRRARAQDRVLLTADHALAARPGARTLLVKAQELPAQLQQVRAELGPPSGAEFSRCLVCNGQLAPVDKAALAGRLPPYVLARHDVFFRCPDCERIYWPGTHVQQMRAMLVLTG